MVNIGNLPPPQQRPGVSIAPEHRHLSLAQLASTPVVIGEEQPAEEESQQAALLSKIANLRKAINEASLTQRQRAIW